jgi:uncharacterized protein (DUF1778 family)
MSNYPSDSQEKFMLRLPAGMRDMIAAAAKAANRSMNAEVVSRLEASFPARPQGGSSIEEALEKIQAMSNQLADLIKSLDANEVTEHVLAKTKPGLHLLKREPEAKKPAE